MKVLNRFILIVFICTISMYLCYSENGLAIEALEDKPIFTDGKTILKLYQLMKDVHEVLVANKVEYWAIAGTLLGAVRHKGIIPWDDDLDICIKKNQISEFLKLKPVFSKLGYELVRLGGIFDLYRIFPKNGAIIRGDKASKYPFMDIFSSIQTDANIYYGWSPSKGKNVAITADELYPIKGYQFGEFTINGPKTPLNYLKWAYGNDCIDVAYCGHSHKTKTQNQKIQLDGQYKIAAQPTGPLENKNVRTLSDLQFDLEIIKVTLNNRESSLSVLKNLSYIFVEAFKKQSENQRKKKRPGHYAALHNSDITIIDTLNARFNNIIETVISQIDLFDTLYISVLKDSSKCLIGYAIYAKSQIKKLLLSMLESGEIKSVDALPDAVLKNDSSDPDIYIVSMAILPKYQKLGQGKRLMLSIISEFPSPKNIYLLTAKSSTNLAVQHFYEHLNFEHVGDILTSDDNLKILYKLEC